MLPLVLFQDRHQNKRMDILRPVQMAKAIDVSPQTLRNYIREFGDFLSDEAQATKKARRFDAKDIAILRRANDLLKEGNKYEKVRSMLPAVADIVGEEVEHPSSEEGGSSDGAMVNSKDVAQLQAMLEIHIEKHDAIVAGKDELLAEKDKRIDELRVELAYERAPFYRKPKR